jgi:hypothetical protein
MWSIGTNVLDELAASIIRTEVQIEATGASKLPASVYCQSAQCKFPEDYNAVKVLRLHSSKTGTSHSCGIIFVSSIQRCSNE